MKAAPFDYHAPTTVAETVSTLAELGDDAKLLAGGQSLVPVLALRLARPEHIVDLNPVEELARVERVDGKVRIGAMVRHVTAATDAGLARDVPLLARAAGQVGHFQIRNRGTVGGSLAHADPAAEYPAVMLALDAELEVASASGARMVPADDFFVSTFMTALEVEDLLVAAVVPARRPSTGRLRDGGGGVRGARRGRQRLRRPGRRLRYGTDAAAVDVTRGGADRDTCGRTAARRRGGAGRSDSRPTGRRSRDQRLPTTSGRAVGRHGSAPRTRGGNPWLTSTSP
jgi:hypothetical protein